MRGIVRALGWAAGLVWVASIPAQAAGIAADHIEGQVRDALERPIEGARVIVQGPDGRLVGTTTSDAKGRFAITGISPGTYAVQAEKPGFETATAIATLDAGAGATADLVLASKQALDLDVTAKKLDEARNAISPRIGANVYGIDQQAIAAAPQGTNAFFNQVLLQAPGVAQDSFGQLHVRGDHANLQYRIDGILLPEGISGFGQTIDSRFASSADLITGALPAQYGYRTSGVVDIQTKSGAFAQGGSVSMYGGTYHTLQPSFEALGSSGGWNYYVTGDYLQDNRGIEPATDGTPIHDHTQQSKGFLYLSDVIDPTTRISFIQGNSISKFQIPNNPGQPINFPLAGVTTFDSVQTNENQTEQDNYAVLALQKSLQDIDFQLAYFSRYSSIHFTPDPIADLLVNGVASDVRRTAFANGLQGDGSYVLTETHTLRAGVFMSGENGIADNTSAVFPTVGGVQSSTTPFNITDNSARFAWLGGFYLQDEWKLTPALTINYGARFDAMDEFIRAHQLSPRINATYAVTATTTLHGGVSRYFTPPPLELIAPESLAKFANTTNAATTALDSPVQPERSTYYDMGITQKITPELQIGLDGYYKHSHDLLDEGQFGAALVETPFNYQTGKQYGLELTGTYKHEKLTVYGNLAYSQALGRDIVSAQFNDPDPQELAFIANNFVHLDHDQRYTASAGASYDFEGTVLSVDGIYGSGLRRGFANTGHLPDYVQINLGASQSFTTRAFGTLVARFDILNVFDEKYEIRDGTGIGVFAPQFGPRRGLFAGLTKVF